MTAEHNKQSGNIGRAEACANIALAKYWGKSDLGDNLTAVPSLSLTLDALRTRTEVVFDRQLDGDVASVGGAEITGRPLLRVTEHLDRIRALSGVNLRARVTSYNNFPTAAGLASSASGFAALAVAAAQAAGLSLSVAQLSSLARKSSASAGRSLFEGFAILGAETDESQALAPRDHWDVAMVVAVIGSGPKAIGSTGGMQQTKETCPYYPVWEKVAPQVFEQVREGVLARDFGQVAEAMEHSTRLMHATMMTSLPPVLYLKGPTIELMHEVARRRAQGQPLAYTMDAGPNVKVFTLGSHIAETERLLRETPGVLDVIVCRPGPAACTLDGGSEPSALGELESLKRSDRVTLPAFKCPAAKKA